MMRRFVYIFLIVFMALSLLVWLAFSRFDFYHHTILAQLQNLTAAQVEVGTIEASIYDFRLGLALRQVVFSDPDRPEEQARIEHFHVGVSLLDSLKKRQPVIVSLASVSYTHLTLPTILLV